MTDTQALARAKAGLTLFKTSGHLIQRIAPFEFLVPSATDEKKRYRVRTDRPPICECPDFLYNCKGEEDFCKHIAAVDLWRAKRQAPLNKRPTRTPLSDEQRKEMQERIDKAAKRLGV